MHTRIITAILFVGLAYCAENVFAGQAPATPTNPILFVTQVPVPQDFTTVAAVFGNHLPSVESAARGGDLMIRYPDGSVKNLTAAAGFGSAGAQQDEKSIAVREPAVHWSGTKALFSMVIGAPKAQYDYSFDGKWQIYEITGLGQNETPAITRIATQPAAFNNVSPCYGTDERILFTSDRPRDGSAHLYPQRDEYERAPIVSGIWSMDRGSGELFLLTHDPSGSFTPTVDSFGRVIFTRWDHLQRDQEADADALDKAGAGSGSFNYSNESAGAAILPRKEEVFPEPRDERPDLLKGTNLNGLRFNQFFPWMIGEDGTGEETINHIGRHELANYFNASINDDPNVVEFTPGNRANKNGIENMLQIKEDPLNPGLYYGIDAPEFATHASGQIITLTGAPGQNPDQMLVNYITARATAGFTDEGAAADPAHSGHYRNPVPLSDGLLIAVHTGETRVDKNGGSTETPQTRYAFRLKTVVSAGAAFGAGTALTPGFSKTVTYWSPDVLVSYSGPLWELDPVEVRVRPKPAKAAAAAIPAQEQQVFDEEKVDVAALKAYMAKNGLALVVSRNLTTRDGADKQQPFNLRVTGTETKTVSAPGKVYDISFLQFFQGDALRGFTGSNNDKPQPGRRLLATAMHDAGSSNPKTPSGAPSGSVQLGSDGSMAAFVPARRAMSWQTTAADGTPVVRERYWLTFQPGEIRTCTSCHGINTADQANNAVPQNKPEALRTLMKYWKANADKPITDGPALASAPVATPNPAHTGRTVMFSAAASGAEPLTYAWDFGDGSAPANSAVATHAYATAGTFNTVVTVTDANGQSTQDSVAVAVTAAVNFKPGKAQIKFDFKNANKDSFSLMGSAPIPGGFDIKAKTGTLMLGTFSGSSDVNAKKKGNTAFMVRAAKDGTVGFSVSLKSAALFESVRKAGFTDGDAKGVKVTLPVSVELNGMSFDAELPMNYSSKAGKSGKGATQ